MKLPVDAILGDVVAALRRAPSLVIEAPPGAGKTTRVPPALLEGANHVLVLEPRRIAARMAARRVAAERGERVGETVGYQVRFEEVAGPATRLRFLTEGVLARRLVSDPRLNGVDIVCLDEFHERHLEGDLALALLRRLQRTSRPELKLVVMSATLDTGPVAHFLGDCPVLRSEGRLFDLAIRHSPYSTEPLEQQVANALESVLGDRSASGDILVFLPGAAEIRRAAQTCAAMARAHDLAVLPLHGDLPPSEQDRAVLPAALRKVILSTNVAESSITVDGVNTVIDSGLARTPSDSPWTGLPTLQLSRVSKASAMQRAGRAGRTGPGRVIRLYTLEDFHRRLDHDVPEISRRELSQLCLDLHALNIENPREIDCLTPPPDVAVSAAESLLTDLGALDKTGCLTPTGRRMTRYPVHPRLARLILESVERGVGEDGCRVTALLSSNARKSPANLLEAMDANWEPQAIQIFHYLLRIVRPAKQRPSARNALERSLFAAFPDRVARRRLDRQLLLATGQPAELLTEDAGAFLIALDIEDRSDRALPLVRLFCPIEPERLEDWIEERTTVEWNRVAERVDAVTTRMYRQIVVEESRSAKPDPARAASLLAEHALEAGVGRFVDKQELEGLLARMAFASTHGPVRSLSDVDIADSLREICSGLRSFAELKDAGGSLLGLLERRAGNTRLLNELAPKRIDLPRRKNVLVHYSPGKPPWIESRLQDFFGLRETPRIARGAASLVVHLLAPNHRPVQTTTDLAGFWQRLYPQVRKELSRKYPKHAWPENPT